MGGTPLRASAVEDAIAGGASRGGGGCSCGGRARRRRATRRRRRSSGVHLARVLTERALDRGARLRHAGRAAALAVPRPDGEPGCQEARRRSVLEQRLHLGEGRPGRAIMASSVPSLVGALRDPPGEREGSAVRARADADPCHPECREFRDRR